MGKKLEKGFIFVKAKEEDYLWYINTDKMIAQLEQGEDISLIESNQGKIDKFDGDIDSYLEQFGYKIGKLVKNEFEQFHIIEIEK